MNLLWAVAGYQFNGGGYGFSIHRLKMRQALAAAGVNLCLDPEDDYKISVHIIRPDYFKSIPGKFNILFTPCEMTAPTVPLSAIPDLLVVPCTHNKDVFSKYYPGLEIEVCPEGVDPELFQYCERIEPAGSEPFRFLFNGNGVMDTRKGGGFVFSAWKNWYKSGNMPANCELIIKTTNIPGLEMQFYNMSNEGLVPVPREQYKRPGVIMDGRNFPVSKLISMYNACHAFLLPSCGEGWGLTLTEAMGTGLPCIWTHYSAPVDYSDESIGYPITDYEMIPFWNIGRKPGEGEPDYYGAAASDESIIKNMQEIYSNYSEALERGKKAAERMHNQYTWKQAAERFVDICKKYV